MQAIVFVTVVGSVKHVFSPAPFVLQCSFKLYLHVVFIELFIKMIHFGA